MERLKTALLAGLVVLSLVQSYFLVYSFPSLGKQLSAEQDYVQTETLGTEARLEELLFPADMVLHFGEDRHTLLYPQSQFYEQIYSKLRSREFKGFQRVARSVNDWQAVRREQAGVELRFGYGVPVELLQRVLKLEGDLLFMSDSIERIWVYRVAEREEVRAYFFSSDGRTVYESIRADLTTLDVEEFVGFGAYQVPYRTTDGLVYVPEEPLEVVGTTVEFTLYSPEQMLRNLFFDPAVTRTIEDRIGTQIYTDSKRGLQVEQDGQWMRFTNPVASAGGTSRYSDYIVQAVSFVNQHGGWDGLHRLLRPPAQGQEEERTVLFQQYVGALPVLPLEPGVRAGMMRLLLQQGEVTEYERSLMTMRPGTTTRTVRYLPGGDRLRAALNSYEKRTQVRALFPALRPSTPETGMLRLEPVWAVRLQDGTYAVLTGALPEGTQVQVPMQAPVQPQDETTGQEETVGQDEATGLGEATGPEGAEGTEAEQDEDQE